MYIGLFYINKENNPTLMSEDKLVAHLAFAMIVLLPSFIFIV